MLDILYRDRFRADVDNRLYEPTRVEVPKRWLSQLETPIALIWYQLLMVRTRVLIFQEFAYSNPNETLLLLRHSI